MRHDSELAGAAAASAPAPGRIEGPPATERPEWGRLARAGLRYERLLILAGIGVAIAALGLVGGRQLVTLIVAAVRP